MLPSHSDTPPTDTKMLQLRFIMGTTPNKEVNNQTYSSSLPLAHKTYSMTSGDHTQKPQQVKGQRTASPLAASYNLMGTNHNKEGNPRPLAHSKRYDLWGPHPTKISFTTSKVNPPPPSQQKIATWVDHTTTKRLTPGNKRTRPNNLTASGYKAESAVPHQR